MASVYSLKITDEGETKTLTFAGDLVINHADKILEELRSALASPTDLNVVIDNPDNIDMTFIQLLVSIRHSCTVAGKKVSVKSTLKDDLKVLLTKGGFNHEFNL